MKVLGLFALALLALSGSHVAAKPETAVSSEPPSPYSLQGRLRGQSESPLLGLTPREDKLRQLTLQCVQAGSGRAVRGLLDRMLQDDLKSYGIQWVTANIRDVDFGQGYLGFAVYWERDFGSTGEPLRWLWKQNYVDNRGEMKAFPVIRVNSDFTLQAQVGDYEMPVRFRNFTAVETVKEWAGADVYEAQLRCVEAGNDVTVQEIVNRMWHVKDGGVSDFRTVSVGAYIQDVDFGFGYNTLDYYLIKDEEKKQEPLKYIWKNIHPSSGVIYMHLNKILPNGKLLGQFEKVGVPLTFRKFFFNTGLQYGGEEEMQQ